jgi:hypothetical protein
MGLKLANSCIILGKWYQNLGKKTLERRNWVFLQKFHQRTRGILVEKPIKNQGDEPPCQLDLSKTEIKRICYLTVLNF